MAWIGAAVSAAGSLLGAGMQSDAAGNAASTQAASSAAAIAEQRRQFDLTRSDMAPWRDTGAMSIQRLAVLLGLTPNAAGATGAAGGGASGGAGPQPNASDFMLPDTGGTVVQGGGGEGGGPTYTTTGSTPGGFDSAGFSKAMADWQAKNASGAAPTSPDAGFGDLTKKFSVADFWNDPVVQLGYQSGLDLGTKALKNAAPLTTGLDSGAALKELTKFGTDYSGQQAGASENRYITNQTNDYNRLAGLAGIGQNAANTVAATGAGTANNISGLISGQGNATAAAKIAQGNAFGTGVNSISNWWNQQQMLSKLTGGGFAGGYGVAGAAPVSSFNSDWAAG